MDAARTKETNYQNPSNTIIEMKILIELHLSHHKIPQPSSNYGTHTSLVGFEEW